MWQDVTFGCFFYYIVVRGEERDEKGRKGLRTVPEGGWTMFTQAPSQQTFSWPAGMKVPQGTMMHDGTSVPEGAEPQPDGTLKLPTGSVSPAEGFIMSRLQSSWGTDTDAALRLLLYLVHLARSCQSGKIQFCHYVPFP